MTGVKAPTESPSHVIFRRQFASWFHIWAWLLQRLRGCKSKMIYSHKPRRQCIHRNEDGGAKKMKAQTSNTKKAKVKLLNQWIKL